VKTRLDDLLEAIHPRRTFDETARRADAALIDFALTSSRATDWETFQAVLVRLHRHVESRVLRLRGEMPDPGPDFSWSRCARLLERAYGPNGRAAFEMARTGNEGGLPAVCKKLAQLLAEAYAEAEVSARIYNYWHSLSAKEKVAAGQEYLTKHGQLLPGELTEGSAARVLASLPKVLEQHAQLMRDLGRLPSRIARP